MKFISSLILVLVSLQSQAFNTTSITIAEQFDLHSDILSENRSIFVSLPANYTETNINYPVLYVLDGEQNIRHIVGSIELLTRTGHIPQLIVVGIKSVDRIRDMTISKVQSESENSGGGDKLLSFIEQELVPHIDKTYRSHSFRILEGHSLGGLLSAYSLINNPDLFQAHIIAAPALWWDNELLAKKTKKFLTKSTLMNKALYFGIGSEDGGGMRQEMKRYVELLSKSSSKSLRIQSREFEGEGHMSAPYLVNYHGLKHIFSDVKYAQEKWNDFSSNAFLQHEKDISEKYGASVKQTNEQYIFLGDHLLEQRNVEGAIAVFKKSLEHYGDYAINHAKIAEAYERNNQIKQAINAYQRAFDLVSTSKKGGGQADMYIERIKFVKKPINNDLLNSYIGHYQSPERTFDIERIGNRLIAKVVGRGEFAIFPKSESLFYIPFSPVSLEFIKATNGKIEKIIMYRGKKKINIPKID